MRATHLHHKAEYSLEVLTLAGKHTVLGATQKWTTAGFIEVAHMFPAESLPDNCLAAISRAVLRLLDRLQVRHGISHWEFIVTGEPRNEQVALVEGHLRPGGDQIPELIFHATGRHPYRLLFEALAGHSPELEPKAECTESVGIIWLTPATPLFVVNDIRYTGKQVDGVIRWYCDRDGIKRSRNWHGPTSFADKFVSVVVRGESATEMEARAKAFAAELTMLGTSSDGSQAESHMNITCELR